jgi:hypothetical protein
MHPLGQMVRSNAITAVARLIRRYRQATLRNRPLPDFIIIGAQKGGTSSLFAYLAQHPQLLPSLKKEVHFFDGGINNKTDNYQKGQAWYRANFPRKDVGARSKAFEASPLYIFNPLVPKRIFDLIPDVKLIALLRNPTERAISHYFHVKEKGYEPLPVSEALRAEESRLADIIDREDYKSEAFRHYSYKSRGLYKEQLDRFLAYFSQQQLLVVGSEDFFRQPDSTLRRVFEFVGIDPAFKVKDLKPRNVGRNRSQVDPGIYEYLDNYFQPHNQALYKLIGENYAW